MLSAPLVSVAPDLANDVRPQQRLAMALDDKVDKPKEHVRVPALAAELVARRRAELVGPHARHLAQERDRAHLRDVRRVRPAAGPEAPAEEEVGVLERTPFAVCWFCGDFLRVDLEPWPA